MLAEQLLSGLEGRGIRARVLSVRRLADVRERIVRLHRDGRLDPEFYQERLTWFDFGPPESLPDARTIVVATVPQSRVRLTFRWRSKVVPVLVPPTYLHWQATNRSVLDAVAELLAPHRFHAAAAALPVKTLVVHSGLGVYGRNNITYVPGLGSFHRPVAVYADLPCDDDSRQEPQIMASCEHCSACRRACPTGAIGQDRFLLHAERCITFHNEKPGNVPFPEWVHPSWHECLVGCLRCQRACPQNKPVLNQTECGPEFNEEETALLLQGTTLEKAPASTMAKLRASDLVEYLDIMPRNLGVLLRNAEVQPISEVLNDNASGEDGSMQQRR